MNRCLLFILILTSIALSSCSIQIDDGEAITEATSDLQDKEVLQGEVVNLIERKVLIDTLIRQNSSKLEVLVQQPDSEELVVVHDEKFPEEVERTFNVWRDETGKIVFIGEYPYSESGDWYIEYKHYFNEAGETFAFERITNFFNSMCTDDVAYEVITAFYDAAFRKLHQAYSLNDMERNKLKKEECEFHYDYPYEVSQSLDAYLRKINYQRN